MKIVSSRDFLVDLISCTAIIFHNNFIKNSSDEGNRYKCLIKKMFSMMTVTLEFWVLDLNIHAHCFYKLASSVSYKLINI